MNKGGGRGVCGPTMKRSRNLATPNSQFSRHFEMVFSFKVSCFMLKHFENIISDYIFSNFVDEGERFKTI